MSAQMSHAEDAETGAPDETVPGPSAEAGDAPQSAAGPVGNAAQNDYWILKYGEDIYGPYSIEAMERYITEGRIADHSIIAPAGTGEWKPARDVSVFSSYFDKGRADQTHSTPAKPGENRPAYGAGKGQVDRRKRPDTNNFIVITDIKSHHGPELERAIMSVGPAMKIAHNAWVINAKTTAPGLLNHLSQHIGRVDRIFVSDATADRIAWFNFGPEMDAKVRRVWRKPVS